MTMMKKSNSSLHSATIDVVSISTTRWQHKTSIQTRIFVELYRVKLKLYDHSKINYFWNIFTMYLAVNIAHSIVGNSGQSAPDIIFQDILLEMEI